MIVDVLPAEGVSRHLPDARKLPSTTSTTSGHWLHAPCGGDPHGSTLVPIWLVGGFVVLVVCTALLTAPVPLVIALYLVWVAVGAMPSRVRLGSDGLVLTWLGIRRFIPYRDVVAVCAVRVTDAAAVHLQLTGGARVVLQTGPRSVVPNLARDQLLADIQDRLHHARRTVSGPRLDHVLRRQGRSTHAWWAALCRLGQPVERPYRSRPLTAAELWTVLSDLQADPEVRAAAATALATSLDHEGHQRLLRLAQGTAHPGLHKLMRSLAQPSHRNAKKTLARL